MKKYVLFNLRVTNRTLGLYFWIVFQSIWAKKICDVLKFLEVSAPLMRGKSNYKGSWISRCVICRLYFFYTITSEESSDDLKTKFLPLAKNKKDMRAVGETSKYLKTRQKCILQLTENPVREKLYKECRNLRWNL